MEDLLNIFDWLVDVITTVYNFFLNTVEAFFSLYASLGIGMTFAQTFMYYVFPPLSASISAVLLFGILKFIIGRT